MLRHEDSKDKSGPDFLKNPGPVCQDTGERNQQGEERISAGEAQLFSPGADII